MGTRVGMDGQVDRSPDRRAHVLRAATAIAALVCVGAAVALGEHGQQTVGGLLMAVALVGALAACLLGAEWRS